MLRQAARRVLRRSVRGRSAHSVAARLASAASAPTETHGGHHMQPAVFGASLLKERGQRGAFDSTHSLSGEPVQIGEEEVLDIYQRQRRIVRRNRVGGSGGGSTGGDGFDWSGAGGAYSWADEDSDSEDEDFGYGEDTSHLGYDDEFDEVEESGGGDSLEELLMDAEALEERHATPPSQIVKYLDRYIVGQDMSKRMVAIALRNRWRQKRLPRQDGQNITPKNILMSGPTGCGKTEIARRLAQFCAAPFIKVDATAYTEVGFHGKDVDSIISDLYKASRELARKRRLLLIRRELDALVEEKVLDALLGPRVKGRKFQWFSHSNGGGRGGRGSKGPQGRSRLLHNVIKQRGELTRREYRDYLRRLIRHNVVRHQRTLETERMRRRSREMRRQAQAQAAEQQQRQAAAAAAVVSSDQQADAVSSDAAESVEAEPFEAGAVVSEQTSDDEVEAEVQERVFDDVWEEEEQGKQGEGSGKGRDKGPQDQWTPPGGMPFDPALFQMFGESMAKGAGADESKMEEAFQTMLKDLGRRGKDGEVPAFMSEPTFGMFTKMVDQPGGKERLGDAMRRMGVPDDSILAKGMDAFVSSLQDDEPEKQPTTSESKGGRKQGRERDVEAEFEELGDAPTLHEPWLQPGSQDERWEGQHQDAESKENSFVWDLIDQLSAQDAADGDTGFDDDLVVDDGQVPFNGHFLEFRPSRWQGSFPAGTHQWGDSAFDEYLAATVPAEHRLPRATVDHPDVDELRAFFRLLYRRNLLDLVKVTVAVPDTRGGAGGLMGGAIPLGIPLGNVGPGGPGGSLPPGMAINLGQAFTDLKRAMGPGGGGASEGAPVADLRDVTVRRAKRLCCEFAEAVIGSQQDLHDEAVDMAANEGIVFFDEVDKIVTKSSDSGRSSDASSEGVQKDLMPIVEGTVVATDQFSIDTTHILFIAAGAFHSVKVSDLMPEFQGRLPLRCAVSPLTQKDFTRILLESKNSILKQLQQLIAVDGVTVKFTSGAAEEVARIAFESNRKQHDLGARRLHQVAEKVIEDISFSAPDLAPGSTITITKSMVSKKLAPLVKEEDLKQYVI